MPKIEEPLKTKRFSGLFRFIEKKGTEQDLSSDLKSSSVRSVRDIKKRRPITRRHFMNKFLTELKSTQSKLLLINSVTFVSSVTNSY